MKNRNVRVFKLTILVASLMLIVSMFAVTIATHAAAPAPQAIGRTIPAGQSDIRMKLVAYYAPRKLTCTRVSGKCSITIKNTTTTSQSVTLKGSVVYTIAAKQSQVISYTTAGTYVYGLSSNSKTILTVTVV